jgi:hypothetical protein
MIRLRGRHAAMVLGVAALTAAGCGSSSKSKSVAKPPTTPATPSTPTTSSTSTTPIASGGYTKQVDTAVAPLITAIQGARTSPLSASAWDQVAKTAGPAKTKIGVLKPPAAVANLQTQLVTLLGRIETDAGSARDAITKHDAAAQKAAGQKVAQDGHDLTALAAKFKAAGFPI